MALIWRDRRRFDDRASPSHARRSDPPPALPPSSPDPPLPPFRRPLLPAARFFCTNESISLDFHFHAPIARVCNRAARRMAAKGYRCTSNYDQCVPSDLTTLFSPPHAPTPNEKCSRPMRPLAAFRIKFRERLMKRSRFTRGSYPPLPSDPIPSIRPPVSLPRGRHFSARRIFIERALLSSFGF